MKKEDIIKVCDYIRTHKPLETDMATIDAAIRAVGVGGVSAITKRELVGEDAWMVPEEERKSFAGVSDGAGSYQAFSPEEMKMIMDAIAYSKAHEGNKDNLLNDPELKEMFIEDYYNKKEPVGFSK